MNRKTRWWVTGILSAAIVAAVITLLIFRPNCSEIITEYTVTFRSQGEVFAETKVKHGDEVPFDDIEMPTMENTQEDGEWFTNTFKGWYLQGDAPDSLVYKSNGEGSYSVTADVTFVAAFEKEYFSTDGSYLVRFYDSVTQKLMEPVEGEAVQRLKYGESAVAPVPPEHDGYEYPPKWSREFNNVTGNMIVTAQYMPKQYTLRKHILGEVEEEKIYFNDGLYLDSSGDRGMLKFVDWYRTEDFSGDPVSEDALMEAKDIDVYARYRMDFGGILIAQVGGDYTYGGKAEVLLLDGIIADSRLEYFCEWTVTAPDNTTVTKTEDGEPGTMFTLSNDAGRDIAGQYAVQADLNVRYKSPDGSTVILSDETSLRQNFTIARKELSAEISRAESNYTYGQQPEISVSFFGFEYSDTSEILNNKYAFTFISGGETFKTKLPVGLYAVSAEIENPANYIVNIVNSNAVTVQIDRKELKVSLEAEDFTYGDGDVTGHLKPEYVSFVYGEEERAEEILGEPIYSYTLNNQWYDADANTFMDAGEYEVKITGFTAITGNETGLNYTINYSNASTEFKVAKRDATVSLNLCKTSLIYGDEQRFFVDDSGILEKDRQLFDWNYSLTFSSADGNKVGVSYQQSEDKLFDAGKYTVNTSYFTESNNYNKISINNNDAEFIVARKNLTVTAQTNTEYVYGDTVIVVPVFYGFVPLQSVANSDLEARQGVTYRYNKDGEPYAHSVFGAGAYTVEYLSGYTSNNYAIEAGEAFRFEVVPKTLHITLSKDSEDDYYYGNNPEIMVSFNDNDFVFGEQSRKTEIFPEGYDSPVYYLSNTEYNGVYFNANAEYTVQIGLKNGGRYGDNAYGNGNYKISVNDLAFKVIPRPVTIRVNAADSVYGEATLECGYTAFSYDHEAKAFVTNEDENSFNFTYVLNFNRFGESERHEFITDEKLFPAGQYSVVLKWSDNPNYALTAENATFEVARRNVAVELSSENVTYGQNPIFGYDYTRYSASNKNGVLEADEAIFLSACSEALTMGGSPFLYVGGYFGAGNYEYEVSFSSTEADTAELLKNYNIVYTNGLENNNVTAFEVYKRELRLYVVMNNFTYGEKITPPQPMADSTYGFVAGESLSDLNGSVKYIINGQSWEPAQFTEKPFPAGNDYVILIDEDSYSSENYNIVYNASADVWNGDTFTVFRREVSVMPEMKSHGSYIYGGVQPSYGYSFVPAQLPNGKESFDLSGDVENFDFNYDVTYTKTGSEVACTYTGGLYGAGNYTVTLKAQKHDPNYLTPTIGIITFSVAKASVTVSLSEINGEYEYGTEVIPQVKFDGLIRTEDVSEFRFTEGRPPYRFKADDSETKLLKVGNIGNYTVSLVDSDDRETDYYSSDNYNFNYSDAVQNFVVNPKTLHINFVRAIGKNYYTGISFGMFGAANLPYKGIEFESSDFVYGESSAIFSEDDKTIVYYSGGTIYTVGEYFDAGEYSPCISGLENGEVYHNYVLDVEEADFTVNKAQIVVTAPEDMYKSAYDGAEFGTGLSDGNVAGALKRDHYSVSYVFDYEPFFNGADSSEDNKTSKVSFRNSGIYTVRFTVSETDGKHNYDIKYSDDIRQYTVTIARAKGVIEGVNQTIANQTFTYTGKEQTVNVNGISGTGDGVISYAASKGNINEETGFYTFVNVREADGLKITVTLSETQNYEGAVAEISVTVNKAEVIIDASRVIISALTYDGAEHSIDCSSVTANFGGDKIEAEGYIYRNAGEYALTFSVAETDNYKSSTLTKTYSVAKRALTVTYPEQNRGQYTGSNLFEELSLQNIVNGEQNVYAISYNGSQDYANGLPLVKNAGTYNINYSIELLSDNYLIYGGSQYESNYVLTVSPREVTVSATAESGIYGDFYKIGKNALYPAGNILINEGDFANGEGLAEIGNPQISYFKDGEGYVPTDYFDAGDYTFKINGRTDGEYAFGNYKVKVNLESPSFSIAPKVININVERSLTRRGGDTWTYTPVITNQPLTDLPFVFIGAISLIKHEAGNYAATDINSFENNFTWKDGGYAVTVNGNSERNVTTNFELRFAINITLSDSNFVVNIPEESTYDRTEKSFGVSVEVDEEGTTYKVEYSLFNDGNWSNWSEAEPVGTNAGKYNLKYKITSEYFESEQKEYTAVIARRILTVPVIPTTSVQYDGFDHYSENVGQLKNIAEGDNLNDAYSIGYEVQEIKNVNIIDGSVVPYTINFTITPKSNYTINGIDEDAIYRGYYQISVTRALLTASKVGDIIETYDGNNHFVDPGDLIRVTGIVNNESADEAYTIQFNDSFTEIVDAGKYTVSYAIVPTNNYTIENYADSYTITINAKPVSAIVEEVPDSTYNGNEVEISDSAVTVIGTVNGQKGYGEISYAVTGKNSAILNTGSYLVAFTLTPDKNYKIENLNTDTNGNYIYSYTVTVNALKPEANPADISVAYNGNSQSQTVTPTNITDVMDAAKLKYRYETLNAQTEINNAEKLWSEVLPEIKDAGKYIIYCEISGENYENTVVSYNLEILKAAWNFDDTTKPEDDIDNIFNPDNGITVRQTVEAYGYADDKHGQIIYTYSYTPTEGFSGGFTDRPVTAATKFVDAGTYVVKYTVSGNNNYVATSDSYKVKIARANGSVTLVDGAKTYEYNGEQQTILLSDHVTVIGDGKPVYSGATVSDDKITFINVPAGEKYVLTVTLPATNNYIGAESTVTIKVNKKLLTVVELEDSLENIYNGQAVYGEGVTVEGGLIGDNSYIVKYFYNGTDYESAVPQIKNAGRHVVTYTITPTANYKISEYDNSYTIEIHPKPLEVKIPENIEEKEFDGNVIKISASDISVEGVIGGESGIYTAECVISSSKNYSAVLNADNYEVVYKVKLLSPNYSLNETSYTRTIGIVKAKLKIDLSDIDVNERYIYDGASRLIYGENYLNSVIVKNSAEIPVSFATVNAQTLSLKDTGEYKLIFSFAESDNYGGEEAFITIIVDKATLTVKGSADMESVYNAENLYAEQPVTVEGIVKGENAEDAYEIVYTNTDKQFINAGRYTVNFTVKPTVNYTIKDIGNDGLYRGSYDIKIAKADYVITVNGGEGVANQSEKKQTYTYNGREQGGGITVSGIVESDGTFMPSYLNEYKFTNANTDGYTVNYEVDASENYNYASGSYKVFINKAQGRISGIESVQTVYTYTGALQTVDMSGISVEGDGELMFSGVQSFTTVAEGNGKTVTLTLTDGVNYNGATEEIKLTVNKAKINVTSPENYFSDYNGTEQGPEVKVTLADGTDREIDSLICYNETSLMPPKQLNATISPVTVTYYVNDLENYEVSDGNISGTYTITINKINWITDIPEILEAVYTGSDPFINKTATVSGAVESDSPFISATYFYEYTPNIGNAYSGDHLSEFINAGIYVVTYAVAATENYKLTTGTYTFVIKRAEGKIDVSGVQTEYTYTGNLQRVETGAIAESDGGNDSLIYTDNTFTTVVEGNGKTVTITLPETNNYSGTTATVTLTVNRAKLDADWLGELIGEYVLRYDSANTLADIVLPDEFAGSLNWTAPGTKLNRDVKSYSCTLSDTDNFSSYTGNCNISVRKERFTVSAATEIERDFGEVSEKDNLFTCTVIGEFERSGGVSIVKTNVDTNAKFDSGGTYYVTYSFDIDSAYADFFEFSDGVESEITTWFKLKSVNIGDILYTIEDALNTANSGTVTVKFNTSFADEKAAEAAGYSGNENCYTVKSGVTLLLPYDGNSGVNVTIRDIRQVLGNDAYKKLELTVGEGLTVINNGTITVGGETTGGGGGYVSGQTSGDYAQITLGKNAGIKSYGNINAYGFIKEESVNNNSSVTMYGGTLLMPFIVVDHRGGSVFAGAYKDLKGAPFNRFFMQNVTSELTVKYGAKLHGWANLYAGSSDNTTPISLVGDSDSYFINLSDGSKIVAKYNLNTKVTDLNIYGSMQLNYLSLNAAGQNISTQTVMFPLTWYWKVALNPFDDGSGATVKSTRQAIKIMPGSALTISKGVTLTIPKLFVYDNSYVDIKVGSGPYESNKGDGVLAINGILNVTDIGGVVKTTEDGAVLNVSGSNSVTSYELESTSGSSYFATVTWWSIVKTLEGEVYNDKGNNTSIINAGKYVSKNGGWITNDSKFNIYYNFIYKNAAGEDIAPAEGTVSTNNPDYYTLNSNFDLQNAYHRGWKFIGWYSDEACENGISHIDGSGYGSEPLTLYGLFEEQTGNVYEITYIANGDGATVSGSQSFTESVAESELSDYSTNSRIPEREGYGFIGWFRDSAGDGSRIESLNASDFSEDSTLTLYAKWQIKTYRLTLSQGTGTTLSVTVDGIDYTSSTDVPYGATVVVHASANSGYNSLVVSTEPMGYAAADGSSFTMRENVTVNTTATQDSQCIVEGTQIMLADGTRIPVEELSAGDEVLIFNHETGRYEAGKMWFIDDIKKPAQNYRIINLEFNDGTVFKICYQHALFNLDLNRYVYINESNMNGFIGHRFSNVMYVNGEFVSGELVLVKVYAGEEYVRVFGPVTEYHMNMVTDSLLTMPSFPYGIEGFINIFGFGDGMKYDEAKMQADIKEYGLFTYEDFAKYMGYSDFIKTPAKWLKVALGKGILKWEDIEVIIRFLYEEGVFTGR